MEAASCQLAQDNSERNKRKRKAPPVTYFDSEEDDQTEMPDNKIFLRL